MPSAALYSVSQIRAIEQQALSILPAGTLMRRAGKATAQFAQELIEPGSGILVLAGPGNNGGDALEAACELRTAGHAVTVLAFADPARLSADASQAWQRAQAAGLVFLPPDKMAAAVAEPWALVIDGLYGIGLTRAIEGEQADLIRRISTLPIPVLAIDVPSGLDADTGNVVGDDGVAIHASHTLSFLGDKPGLHTGQGRDHAGEIRVDLLEVEPASLPAPAARLADPSLFADCLRPRAHNSHKGSFGDATIAGGAEGMGGAAVLAASAAAKSGAGRVFIAFLDHPPSYDPLHPELMCRAAAGHDFTNGASIAGPGLGRSSAALALLLRVLEADQPLVLDADALNLIAEQAACRERLGRRRAACIMTPHPLEAARLLGVSAKAVQADRLSAAHELASRFGAVIVLKGSGTIIASPSECSLINPTGNPALATAGTGDVLAGVCGALLAQGWPAWQAATAAVWLHGHAADNLVNQQIGPIGLTASELIPAIRAALNHLVEAQHWHARGMADAFVQAG